MNIINERQIELSDTGSFSKIILDYTSEKENLKNFYHRSLKEENFIKQAEEKLASYKHRNLLVTELKEQFKSFDLTAKQQINLDLLADENAVTITTGHQLNLFTGPVYFFYKILQAIRTCDELNKKSDKIKFIPVFWMATEDHDFSEINHFQLENKKISWEKEFGGPVGRINTDGLDKVSECFFNQIPNSTRKEELRNLFDNAYLEHKTLAEATRYLVNELFKNYGLLIIDADSNNLKKAMIPYFKEELLEQTSSKKVGETNELLRLQNYSIQVNPREINLFYMRNDSSRDRIIKQGDVYSILDTDLYFSKNDIINELEKHPERFSPNVLLRPLYQEVILPNVSYIGGGGEMAYWLQLKSFFDSQKIPFPILTVRNSFLIQSEKESHKLEKLNISTTELFLPLKELVERKVMEKSNVTIDFSRYENILKTMFNELSEESKKTDKTLENMIKAQETKQLKGLDETYKRLIKAETRVHSDLKHRIESIHNELFPNKNLQERIQNFSLFYLAYGSYFIESIYSNISPFKSNFSVYTL